MKTPNCTHDIAESLTELCQKLVSRAGHEEAYDTEPRYAFQDLLQGATLRTPDQFQMFTAEGNQACVRALVFVLDRPELVNLFGLNKALFDELKQTGSIHPARQELETGS